MEIEVYCDESRQDLFNKKHIINNNNRYICLGGISIDKDIREDFKKQIRSLQDKYKVFGEIKWKNANSPKNIFYQELITLFFNYKGYIKFKCLVIDTSKLYLNKEYIQIENNYIYNSYYKLLDSFIYKENKYNILIDYRKDKLKTSLYGLKEKINKELNKEVIENIQFIESKESLLLQLQDVLMGAIGYKYNFAEEGKSKCKSIIVKETERYIKDKQKDKIEIIEMEFKGEGENG